MNKSDLINAIADGINIPKTIATNALEIILDSITKTLKANGTVQLVGFGTFLVRERKARQGRNPRTGETISIKAAKNPVFKAGKALKDAIQEK